MQIGRHHVNCQPHDVVIAKMKERGWIVDDVLSHAFSHLRVPSKGGTKYAFAEFYRSNTRVYRRVL
jgi:hypothetical protein